MLAWINDHQTILTVLVAAYAAVVATAVAGWNIYRSVTDGGRLRVQVVRADQFGATGVTARDKLWFKVTNVGRQPIWLTQIGGGYRARGKHFLIVTLNGLPKKLEPGEMFDDASSDARTLDPERVAFLAAWDSFDKVHKLPKRNLRALVKEIRGDMA